MKPLLFSVLPRPTHPTRDGLAIRNFHLLQALARTFEVRAFVLCAPHLAGASEYPEGVEAEEFPQRPRRLRQAFSAAASALLGGAYSPRLYRSRRLSARLARETAAGRPSWIVAHSYHVAPLAFGRGRPAWIDFHNLDSQIWDRTAASASARSVRALSPWRAPSARAFDSTLVARADGISCVSAPDARELSRLASGVTPLLVPNGVDLDRYRFRERSPGGGVVLFVGDLSWHPNADGLRWFADRVWPVVQARAPRARVEVVGRDAPADLPRRAPEWSFLGEGGDTQPPWARADAALVPLPRA